MYYRNISLPTKYTTNILQISQNIRNVSLLVEFERQYDPHTSQLYSSIYTYCRRGLEYADWIPSAGCVCNDLTLKGGSLCIELKFIW